MEFIPGIQDWYSIHKLISVIHHVNKRKGKNHIIISIDIGKAFAKVQHPFMIKTLRKVALEGTHLNIIKAIYGLCQHHTQQAKTTSLALKIKNTIRVPTFTSLIQHSTRSPSHSNQARRKNKRHPNWKGRSKTVFICR